ncbi:MAG: glycine--tRNA ligase subunit beta [Pseudomonadales bacterium]
MSSADLLIELGTEELPPLALQELSASFSRGIVSGLTSAGLRSSNGVSLSHSSFASPRRLAILVHDVPKSTPEQRIEKLGPNIKAAFDADGKPSKAASGFAAGCGVEVADLETIDTPKGERLVYISLEPGKQSRDFVQSIVQEVLNKLPIPKRMRWGNRRDEFIRPVKWLLALHGSETIELNVYGVTSGITTRAHRFMGEYSNPNHELDVPEAANYESILLKQGFVVADFDKRKQIIREQLEVCAKNLGGNIVVEEALLDEVCGLVEWPHCLSGTFDTEFLALPKEALISSMRSHQKYFHVLDKNGALLPNFVTVANIDSKDTTEIISGNERVIRPRLADAQFFYSNDARQPLASMAEKLQKVVFQDQLGSVGDKTQRIAQLADFIGQQHPTAYEESKTHCQRAAELCKADLVSDMVGEFADLQGVMGRYYASDQNEAAEVAAAIEEHYLPRFAGDRLPETQSGLWISMADRVDTLVGIFGIGQPPTGSKDPFALRRSSVGLLRIMIEKNIEMPLGQLIAKAASLHKQLPETDVEPKVLAYILERLRSWYSDKGVKAETLHAVLHTSIDNPVDIDRRVHAVTAFAALEQSEALAAANKRVSNLLAKQDTAAIPASLNSALFSSGAETELADAIKLKQSAVEPLLASRDYERALSSLADLKEPIDRFFDSVMVLDEDPAIRANRLALLQQLRDLFSQIADISQLAK